jgi:hypothetical protein
VFCNYQLPIINQLLSKMRLWSIHPKYLDSKGLIALWREALLAQKVLQGKTKGYRYHPQLVRFRAVDDPLATIATYLVAVHEEAVRRGYHFNECKIVSLRTDATLPVTEGQVDYELAHLKHKLLVRDPKLWQALQTISQPDVHPLFFVVAGNVEDWEKLESKALALDTS